MAADPLNVELKAGPLAVKAAIDDAREAFLAANRAYRLTLDRRAKEQTEPYYSRENERDEFIQGAAHALVGGIDEFAELRTQLTERVAILLQGGIAAALSSTVSILQTTLEATAVPDRESVRATVSAFLESLDKAGKAAAILEAQACWIGVNTAQAMQGAADLISLRQAEIELYVKGFTGVDLDSLLTAAGRVVAVDAGFAIFEEILQQSAITALTAFPPAAVLVGVVRIVAGVKQELDALTTNYARTELDDMLAFSRRIPASNQVARDLLQLLVELDAVQAT